MAGPLALLALLTAYLLAASSNPATATATGPSAANLFSSSFGHAPNDQHAALSASRALTHQQPAVSSRIIPPFYLRRSSPSSSDSLLSAASAAAPKTYGPRPPVFGTKDAYRVNNLPGVDLRSDEYTLYAGHIAVDDKNSTLYFMYFERVRKSKDVIVWLNGGPGSSSLFGQFAENGPLFADGTTNQIQHNPYGWHKAGNALFLEQPAGVGYAHVDSDAAVVTSNHQVGEHFWAFTQQFERLFGKQHHHPGHASRSTFKWWITGESFAGTFIPYIATHILDHNQALATGEVKLRLAGVAIGNGWFESPVSEPVNYVDFMDKEGLLVDPAWRAKLLDMRTGCYKELLSIDWDGHPGDRPFDGLKQCRGINEVLGNQTLVLEVSGGKTALPTWYDVRVTKPGSPDPTDASAGVAAAYLDRADVKLALHAGTDKKWKQFNEVVNRNLWFNNDLPSVRLLPGIVDAGVKVLVYNGDRDFICNYVGAENMLDTYLAWGRHHKKIGFGKTQQWKRFGPKGFGKMKRARGLTYVRVFEAGHMVPFNQPEGSLEMIVAFVRGKL
ncbi:Alpha/Beta hydrolase protein [Catenaria anguillulae PL171]|uniref:Alpha/Beta hydrolase protein n=1 Tax=Catenaria anguillulae PL171 TaxID=765915 RepID=A0A1Y2HFC4_9FUNG|nr:Alpha/Beta hydrolase protein [Catenaria anguillulae PL171]